MTNKEARKHNLKIKNCFLKVFKMSTKLDWEANKSIA